MEPKNVKLLLDTNIFLEVLLDQERSQEARKLLSRPSPPTLYISDFTLLSIGTKLFRTGAPSAFVDFVEDIVVRGIAVVATLPPGAAAEVADAAAAFKLDFDDAYQYAVSKWLDAAIVSFDRDFDRTERGRKTPDAVLAEQGDG